MYINSTPTPPSFLSVHRIRSIDNAELHNNQLRISVRVTNKPRIFEESDFMSNNQTFCLWPCGHGFLRYDRAANGTLRTSTRCGLDTLTMHLVILLSGSSIP
jgi:hypothetical protein